MPLGDEAIKVIVNADGKRDGLSEDLCSFLDFIQTGRASSRFTKELDSAVQKAVENREWEVEYMTMLMKINEACEDVKIEERINTALKFGISQEKIIDSLVDDFDLTKDEARERLEKHHSVA